MYSSAAVNGSTTDGDSSGRSLIAEWTRVPFCEPIQCIWSPAAAMSPTDRPWDMNSMCVAQRPTSARSIEFGQLAVSFNRMAENLEKIQRLRRTLMIDVAHELRTPLTNMRGYLEALNDGVLPPDPDTLALLQDETLRLVQLVEDVLALARADAATGQLQPEAVDLKAMVENTIVPFTAVLTEKSLTVNIDDSRSPATIMADPGRLARVLRNLADNAVQYAPPGTTVDVRITESHEKVRVDFANAVSDLLPEDLPYLFERFYRGEKSRSRHHGGAGIGLSIVKELVEAHGGKVYARLLDGVIHIGIKLPRSGGV